MISFAKRGLVCAHFNDLIPTVCYNICVCVCICVCVDVGVGAVM